MRSTLPSRPPVARSVTFRLQGGARAEGAGARPRSIQGVIDALIAVMMEENAALAAGVPAALVHTVDEKQQLSEEYARLWETLSLSLPHLRQADPQAVDLLVRRVRMLRAVADENMARLEEAMQASRRRVQAVLTALRQDAGGMQTGPAPGRAAPLAACLSVPDTAYPV
ncbi:hypothetical protein [Novispirillum itersonii]|uniref:hypothetical protein n=1 Tax=Novispirillum itersonii TaxID=189 RepID=UPI0003782CF5|nr:hypothetical protein [Novispirillum itersonii]